MPIDETKGTETDASSIVVGAYGQLMRGVGTRMVIQMLRERYADTLQTAFLVYLRADVQVAQPKAFTVIEGIIP